VCRTGHTASLVSRLVAPLVLAFIAATFAVGLTLDASGVHLGTPKPPLLFDWHPRAEALWVLVAVAVCATAVWIAPRLLALRPVPFGLAIFGLALAVRLAVATMRYGTDGWTEPWDTSFNAKNEYVPALPAIEALGVRFFLDRFDDILPALPVHVAGHPPGLVLLFHWLGLDTPGSAAALTIVLGTLAVPLTYVLGRIVLDERRARLAGLLSALASGTILYGVLTADVVFAMLGAAAAALMLARPAVALLAGPAALAVASFFSYAVLAMGAWAAFVRLLREGWRRAFSVAAAAGAGLVVFYVLVWLATGFSLPAVVVATEEVYRESVARLRPYAFWLFGSPAAFLFFCGLPITWYAARALGARHPAAVALALVILVSAVGGFTKAETERIWLMYVPAMCVAAAAVLPERRLTLVLGLLAAQALLVEVLFGTVW
jgi:methylthioxylose transferase